MFNKENKKSISLLTGDVLMIFHIQDYFKNINLFIKKKESIIFEFI